MSDRERWPRGQKLPEASDAFADAILAGGERIRRYERRRRRITAVSALAACAAVLALAAGLFFGAFRPPQPDNVVAAAPSQSLAPTGTPAPEASQSLAPTGTPAPEASPGPAQTAPEPVEPGGPVDDSLEPYTWLKVVGSAELDLDYANFFQQPRLDAMCVLVAAGTMVSYIGDAGNGFVEVRIAGTDGYMQTDWLRVPGGSVPMYVVGIDALEMTAEPGGGAAIAAVPRHARVDCVGVDSVDSSVGARWARIGYGDLTGWVDSQYLSFFWESDDWKCYSAKLTINDATGDLRDEGFLDRSSLGQLEMLIQNAKPGVLGQCPQGALLELALRDDTTLTFTMPLDGCGTLLCDNLAVYDLGEEGAELFWELFPECAKALR